MLTELKNHLFRKFIKKHGILSAVLLGSHELIDKTERRVSGVLKLCLCFALCVFIR